MPRLGPLPDAPRTVKLRLIGQNQTFPWVNVLHIQWGSGGATPDSSNLNAMAIIIGIAWTARFAPLFITNSSLTNVEVTDISSRTGAQGNDPTNRPGTNATAGAPLSVAACISWTIARRYRGGHPRTYLSGVDASAYTSGKLWTGAKIIAYQAAATGFRSDINAMTVAGNTWALANVSYYQKVAGVVSYRVPPVVDLISGSKFHTRLDTQRRRLGKETV
jgi:hypothetical protein